MESNRRSEAVQCCTVSGGVATLLMVLGTLLFTSCDSADGPGGSDVPPGPADSSSDGALPDSTLLDTRAPTDGGDVHPLETVGSDVDSLAPIDVGDMDTEASAGDAIAPVPCPAEFGQLSREQSDLLSRQPCSEKGDRCGDWEYCDCNQVCDCADWSGDGLKWDCYMFCDDSCMGD